MPPFYYRWQPPLDFAKPQYTYARLWRIPFNGDPPEMGIYKRERGGWTWVTGGTNFDVGFLDVLKRLGVPKSVWP